ncbi:hypothetical protein [Polymorphospora rubra]|uniref:Uncharacterized protein n=1 Tax=Polymorphospora rubra TaxID=338584 RepID=A0A810MXJ4_9ACTN|nr:hypothetical protein [Polymorphospora rubra]BCJ64115.1 hypothetical protein Prubr_11360 [Polymorphospora rubra]
MSKPSKPPEPQPRRPQPATRPANPPVILPRHPRYTGTAVAVLERPAADCYVCLAPGATDRTYGVPLCGRNVCERAFRECGDCGSPNSGSCPCGAW